LEQDLAGWSQPDGLPGPIKKPVLVLFFELADLRAYCGLRAKHLGSRAREIPFFCNFDERLKVV
jgi:hypothetical protein